MAPTNHRRPIPSPSAARSISALLLSLLLITPRCSVAQSSPSSGSSNNDDDDYSYFDMPNYNSSTGILIGVLITGFFVLGFFSMYLRWCSGGGMESVRFSVRGGAEWRPWRQRGLDPAVLESFPTLVYSEVKELKIGKEALECAVCLSEFEDDETLRLLPKCSHVFHPDCIDAWLASHVTCPVCRSNLVPGPDAARTTAADPQPPAPVTMEGTEGDGEWADAAPATEQVVVTVEEEAAEMETREEAAELERIRNRKREMRSRSGRRPARFPRSHSTGHSTVQPGENLDRFTLRLPEHILLKIAATGKLHRSTSCVALPIAGEGSSRQAYRGGGGNGWEGSSRGGRFIRLGLSGRWPSFFVRRGDGEGSVKKGDREGSTKGKRSAVASFDCLGGGGKTERLADEGESSGAALARRV